jgi:hypothetical protein
MSDQVSLRYPHRTVKIGLTAMALLNRESEKQRKAVGALAAFAIAAVAICVGLYTVGSHLLFLIGSTVSDAQIIEVRHEYVPRGRGSALAYVPVIQLPDSRQSIKVATYDEQPVYTVGSSLSVRCKVGSDQAYCTDPSLFWLFIWPLLSLAIGGVMLIVGFLQKADISHPDDELLRVVPQ